MNLSTTQAERDSRQRIARIDSLISEAISHATNDPEFGEKVTINEVLIALNAVQNWWLQETWRGEVSKEESEG